MDDVAQLTVGVFHQRNSRRAVRIVFHRLDTAGHAEFVALEVDDAVFALVTTTAPTHGNVTVIIAPAALLERRCERPLRFDTRDLRKIGDAAEAGAGANRLEFSQSHFVSPRRPRWCPPRAT